MKYEIIKPYGMPWKITRDGEDITPSVNRLEYTVFGEGPEKNSSLILNGESDTTSDVALDVQSNQYWVLSKNKNEFWVFTAQQRAPSVIQYVQLVSVLKFSVIWHVEKGNFLIDVLSVWPTDTNLPNLWKMGNENDTRRLLILGEKSPPVPAKRDRFSMLVRK